MEGEAGLCTCGGGLVAVTGLDPAQRPTPCVQASLAASLPSSRRELPATFKPHVLPLAPGSLAASILPIPVPPQPRCPPPSAQPPSVCLSVAEDPIPLLQARPSPLFPEMATSPLLSSLQEQSQNSSLSTETGHHFISGLEWEIGAWDERIE